MSHVFIMSRDLPYIMQSKEIKTKTYDEIVNYVIDYLMTLPSNFKNDEGFAIYHLVARYKIHPKMYIFMFASGCNFMEKDCLGLNVYDVLKVWETVDKPYYDTIITTLCSFNVPIPMPLILPLPAPIPDSVPDYI